MFYAGAGEASPRGRACILVPSNYGRAIAIMIRDSAFRRHLIAVCCLILLIDCCTVHLVMSAGVDAVVLVVARPVSQVRLSSSLP